jgi:hypothetical protein
VYGRDCVKWGKGKGIGMGERVGEWMAEGRESEVEGKT